MSIASTAHDRPERTDEHGARSAGFLPEPAPRVGAHVYAGKRVRDDAREALFVMAFSVAAAVGLAVLLTLAIRLAG